ncbi:MAG: hypothetical protein AAF405_01055, partial [Pseudomonadota bacterium]
MTAASTQIALPQSKTVQNCETYARFAGLLVCVIGEIVLATWIGIIPETVMPSLAGIPPIAALGVILAGLGLLCFTFKRIRVLARLAGIILALFGVVMLGQGALGGNLGLDSFLVPDATQSEAEAEMPAGRQSVAPQVEIPQLAMPRTIAPNVIIAQTTAPGSLGAIDDALQSASSQDAGVQVAPGILGALLLFGIALFYAEHTRTAPSALSQVLALVLLAQVLLVVAGWAYGVDMTADAFPFMPLTIYGVATVLFLATGLIAASPERGIASAILEKSPAGEMLRRLLPGILTVPLILG